jgi:hypothetical protein
VDEAGADNLHAAERNGGEGQAAIDAEIGWARTIVEDIDRWERATPEERERASAYLPDFTELMREIDRIWEIEDEAAFEAAWDEWLNREE